MAGKTPQKKTTAKAAAAWTQDLDALDALAQTHSFPQSASFFDYSLEPVAPGARRVATIRGSITAKDAATFTGLRVPDTLKQRIKEEVEGPAGVALVALAEAHLDYLKKTGQHLIVANK